MFIHDSYFCSTKQKLLEISKIIFHDMQSVAVEALKHFVTAYLGVTDDKGTNDIALKYLEKLNDANVAVRRGSALAIGVLPFEFLAATWKNVLPKLCSSCAIEVNSKC